MIGITGGSGLIGSHLVKIFLKESIPFHSFGSKKLTCSDLESFCYMDLNNFSLEDFRLCLDGIKSFIHLAARLPSRIKQDHIESNLLLNINASASLGLLQACKQVGVAKFIYLSSSSIMNPVGSFITSASPFSSVFHSPSYSISKLAGELLCWNQRSSTFDVNILRPASVYGYGMRAGVVKNFVESILADLPVKIYGDGNWASDLVCAQDVARVIFHSLHNDLTFPLNIGTGNLISIHRLALTICELCKKSQSLVHLVPSLDPTSSLVGLSPVDPSEVESFLGLKMLSLEEGLSQMIYQYKYPDA